VSRRTGPNPSVVARTRALAARVEAKASGVAERAQVERQRHRSVAAVFEMVDHDSEVGGDIMAGALAYRLFVWLLPFALVVVAGIGVAADAESTSPSKAAESVGLAGVVSSSVASAARSSARWYALLIGVPLLLYVTRSFLRALIVTHRLVWGESRGTAPRPTPRATLLLLAAMVGFFLVPALGAAVRAAWPNAGILTNVVVLLPYAALWLFVSSRLPHRQSSWRDLVPGAILFGVGIEVLHVVTAYFIAPQVSSREGTYGSLGVAAALLLGLFLASRLVVASAVLNAILWERRTALAAVADVHDRSR
jgi:membrane protein